MKITNILLAMSFVASSLSAQTSVLQFADSLRRAANIPELAYAVITESNIPLINVMGYHRKDANDTARLDDMFHLGSNTKAITSFVAAKLVEQGKINWDTKLMDIFPTWRDSSLSTYHEVTLEQLLSHRAGIQAFTSGMEYGQLPEFIGETKARRLAFCQYLLRKPAVRPKLGEKTVYSNAGYAIAAAMLEKVTGQSWASLVLTHIGDHFNAKVGFSWPNRENEKQPWGHISGAPTPPDHGYRLDPMVAPAGDINMSIGDYAKFVQEHLQGLRGKDGYLKAETIHKLHFGFEEYALGWGSVQREGEWMTFHDGSAGTFYCHTVIIPTSNVAIIVVANAAGQDVSKAIYALRKRLVEDFQEK